MDVVTITASPLTIEELLAVARGAEVALGDDARAAIAASRDVVDRMVEGDEPVYGLNTGVGHRKDVRLPVEQLRETQEMLLMTHAGGTGEPLSTERVRAAMAARLNGIARGGAGASPRVADVLVEMLNASVHPVVPSRGSVGTGDLGQLAFVGQVAIGRARAELGGEILPGAEALRRAGIEPLGLEPKDGLTLMSSNAVSIGDGAIALMRATRAASRAEVIAALSLEAIHGNPSIARPIVGEAKPFPGQIESCAALEAALEGSFLWADGAASSVQDPLSFRVIPQVHGAFREAVAAARHAVETELNGRGDNPLVSIDDDMMVHNGNFHPLVMAIAFDHLRIAAAHVGQISDRRMSHLWDTFFERVVGAGPPPPGWEPPVTIGLALRYPAAAASSELKQLAVPATLDVPPLDIGVEDHATGAPIAVRKTFEALNLLEEILSIEVMMANDVLATEQEAPAFGSGTVALAASARGAIDRLGDDRSPGEAQRAVADELFT
ncbi:MAG TPA: aromatic amino acid ammonia-lyase [Actinomycetota bacterium]|nr:aromatic amino acid ammonia-lyase [Actinomycetota bacterium]